MRTADCQVFFARKTEIGGKVFLKRSTSMHIAGILQYAIRIDCEPSKSMIH